MATNTSERVVLFSWNFGVDVSSVVVTLFCLVFMGFFEEKMLQGREKSKHFLTYDAPHGSHHECRKKISNCTSAKIHILP